MDLEPLLLQLSSGDRDRRAHAVDALVRAGETAVPALIDLAQHGQWLSRMEALRALGRIGDPAALPIIRASLESSDDEVREVAAEAAGTIQDVESLPVLIRLLRMRELDRRKSVREALIRMGEPSVPFLLEAAGSGPLRARAEAIRALGSIGDPRALPIVRDALRSWWPAIRIAGSYAAGDLRDSQSLPTLVAAFRRSTGREAVAAARALARLGDRDASIALIELASWQREHGQVAQEAARQSLRDLGAAALPALLAKLDTDGLGDVVGPALLKLRNAAVPDLSLAHQNSRGALRNRAASLLCALDHGTAASTPQLVETLRDHSHRMREIAARGLIRLAERGPDPQLCAAIEPLRHACTWSFPGADELHFYRQALAASTEATAEIERLPLPASGPASGSDTLPRPAAGASLDTTALPTPSAEPP